MKNKSTKIAKIVIECALILFILVCTFYDWNSRNSYEQYNTSSLTYVKGVVVSVSDESLAPAEEDAYLMLGSQKLLVKVKDGIYKGSTVEVLNYLVRGHASKATKGTRLIICVDGADSANPYFTVYNYDRTVGLMIIFVVFGMILVLTGKRKGVYALAGLIFSATTIISYTIQSVYHGGAPVTVSIVTVLSISVFTFVLICDDNRKLIVSVISTFLGIAAALAAYAVFARILHISGYNSEEVDALVLISRATGLSIRNILLVPVSVTALGAVMDTTLSLASSLSEITEHNKSISQQQVFISGINIGKDMICTMSNTLILAIIGGNFLVAILLISYGYQPHQLLSSDIMALQIAESIAATIAVIVSAPITAAIFSLTIGSRKSLVK